jgi:hypothetical protein
MKKVLDRPEFEYMRVDFHRDLEYAIRALLVGLLTESREA